MTWRAGAFCRADLSSFPLGRSGWRPFMPPSPETEGIAEPREGQTVPDPSEATIRLAWAAIERNRPPTRRRCNEDLSRQGVYSTQIPPSDPAALFRPRRLCSSQSGRDRRQCRPSFLPRRGRMPIGEDARGKQRTWPAHGGGNCVHGRGRAPRECRLDEPRFDRGPADSFGARSAPGRWSGAQGDTGCKRAGQGSGYPPDRRDPLRA